MHSTGVAAGVAALALSVSSCVRSASGAESAPDKAVSEPAVVRSNILRADYAFRAVPVRAGTHRVDMVFDPWSVKIGIAVTLLTLITAIIGIIVNWIRSN